MTSIQVCISSTHLRATLVIAVIGYTPVVLSSYSIIPQEFGMFVLLSELSPTIAAVVLTHREFKGEVGPNLFRAFKRGGFSPGWYLIAIIIPILLFLGTMGLEIFFGMTLDLSLINFGVFIPILVTQIFMNVWEEIGWRGYALPRLQKKHNALISSLIIGLVAGLWHLPLFLMKDSAMLANYDGSYVLFMILIILGEIKYTWLYNSTNGNLMTATLLHASTNAAGFTMLFLPGITLPVTFRLTVFAILVVLIIIAFGIQSLSNKEKVTIDMIIQTE